MEHLFSAAERAERQAQLNNSPSMPWLGFNHEIPERSLDLIEDYPLRRGWTRESVQQLELGHLGRRSPDEAIAMIQSWMSLGLLESAFNTAFKVEDFVRLEKDGSQVVQTAYLREWIDDFHSSIHAVAFTKDPADSQPRERLIYSIEYAAHWNQRLFDLQTENENSWTDFPMVEPVTRMITLIAEAVWAVGQFMPSAEARSFIQCEWVIIPVNDRDLRTRVQRRGWCPSLFDKIKGLSRTPFSVLEYVSAVPPFREARNHHRACSVAGCVEYNVSESNYLMQHRILGCKCEEVIPPLQAVKEALMNRKIPIINGLHLLSQDNDVVQPFIPGAGVPYVAISHVWSDGLGGTTESGMLRCNVEYLTQLALKIGDTPYIWIDSLCIPKAESPRKVAISMMADTYRLAHRTLVLDKGIMQCASTLSLESRMLALSLSTWQGRLWTLQESSLSSEVRFVLKDAVISADSIMRENRPVLHRPVLYTLYTLMDNLTYWVQNNLVTVGGLQRNLYCRTSSKPGDESLAVAPFLNIDISALLQVDGEVRMAHFWKLTKHLPKSIVIHNAPKLSLDGFRWAPRSIMNQKDSMIMDLQDRSAVVVGSGLLGKFWVYNIQFYTSIILKNGSDILFYDVTADGLLRIWPVHASTNLQLSKDHVIVLLEQPKTPEAIFVGAIVRKLPNRRDDHGQLMPTFQFEDLISGDFASKAKFLEISGKPQQDWIQVSSGRRRADGKLLDIIVC